MGEPGGALVSLGGASGEPRGGSGGAVGAQAAHRGSTWAPQGVPGASDGDFGSSNFASNTPEPGHQELIDMIYQG